jgi:hypothetical protein
MSLEIMGDFRRHDRSVIPASKALDVRSKRVHDLYTKYEKSIDSNGWLVGQKTVGVPGILSF